MERQLGSAMMAAYQEAKDRYGYKPTRFVNMLLDKGAFQTATELINAPGISDGLTTLYELNRLDLSVEAIALQEPWVLLFPEETISVAKNKLTKLGYEFPDSGPEGWTDDELRAAVDAYFSMLKQEKEGHKYNKAAMNRELREGAL